MNFCDLTPEQQAFFNQWRQANHAIRTKRRHLRNLNGEVRSKDKELRREIKNLEKERKKASKSLGMHPSSITIV